ncbi:MAG: J domain-containing protein [Alphaproteobacteria bacterium]|uniref:J domain-containing protein n=1 Tax=Candidatus Nitrobium versatile TaxID=2884831 RepID=A0A953J4E5_9BACT|nr:J domain-containing protein [Candidatus Nitrobium versatile]
MSCHPADTLYRACTVLFGPDVVVSQGFLSYLELSGVKSAYRRRALATHPDRVIIQDEEERKRNTELFIEANWAYRELVSYLRERDRGDPSRRSARPEARPTEAHAAGIYRTVRFYSGGIPRRPLLFGEYLYYSGRVPWNAFIGSIIWQRRQRPRFGDIAKRWRYLSDQDIREIISHRGLCEPMGETSLRLNLLSRLQVNTVLMHQRMQQRKIGEYFTENGYLTAEMLQEILLAFKRHNHQFKARGVK